MLLGSRLLGMIALTALVAAAPAGAIDFDPKLGPALRAQLEADIAEIRSYAIAGPAALYREIFGERASGPELVRWFTKRIARIGYDDCGTPKAVACVRY